MNLLNLHSGSERNSGWKSTAECRDKRNQSQNCRLLVNNVSQDLESILNRSWMTPECRSFIPVVRFIRLHNPWASFSNLFPQNVFQFAPWTTCHLVAETSLALNQFQQPLFSECMSICPLNDASFGCRNLITRFYPWNKLNQFQQPLFSESILVCA